MEDRHIIWSNENLDLDDWREDLQEQYPDCSEDELYRIMCETNADYLSDERVNLNIQLSQPILVIADLGLWNGRRMGYKEIPSGNIRDCLSGGYDYTTWYVDKKGDFRCDDIHHDGTNHYLYEEAVAIICNEEGKFNGMMPNRAIYSEPQEIEMSYGELTSRFREAERNGGEHLTGYIVFTEDSFTKPYPEAARTYAVSSNNKAFQPNMGGYSIYASALDGSDPMIRLEGYMQSEKGGKDGWKIERCYMKSDEKEMIDVIFGPFFICDCSGPNYGSLNQEQIDRFMKQFENPERLIRMNGTLMSVPYKPEPDLSR